MGNQLNDNGSENVESLSTMEMAETMAAGSIEFRNVTFGYKPEKPILHQMSFHVEAGQTLGLVIIKIVLN
jgi:ABC-type multidrug transport system fused ATPase/permease subunit